MSKDVRVIHTISCGTCLYRPSDKGGYDILLVRPHKDRDRWGIPKGHLDPGETVRACAVRETLEETGFVPVLEDPLPDVKVKHMRESKTVKSFLAQATTPRPTTDRDGENYDVEWFHYDALPELHRYQISLLEAAVAMLKAR